MRSVAVSNHRAFLATEPRLRLLNDGSSNPAQHGYHGKTGQDDHYGDHHRQERRTRVSPTRRRTQPLQPTQAAPRGGRAALRQQRQAQHGVTVSATTIEAISASTNETSSS